jgi:hypothetical protein
MQPHRDEEGEEDDEEEDEIDTTPEQMSEFMEQFDRLGLGMRDDTSIAPTALRFSVGNLVIYKPRGMMFGILHAEDTVGGMKGRL